MEILVTTFRNPFSFFCLPAVDAVIKVKNVTLPEKKSGVNSKINVCGVMHGQYVAVLWNDHWVRGIVSMETQFLIWLVDYGFYLRPSEKTVYVNLPSEDKKYPTKVFEASLHGVVPLDKIVSELCEIKNIEAKAWTQGAIERAQSLILNAIKIYFVPVATLSTKFNDVVLGDLYFRINGQGIVSLKDALLEWPMFLNKDTESYLQKLSHFYTNRRQHHSSAKKPAILQNLPTITPGFTVAEYNTICENVAELVVSDCDSSSTEGSTFTYVETLCNEVRSAYHPTPEEIEKYSNMIIAISGREYNVLNVLCNKARDLYMCEKYADQKYIGRANSRYSASKCIGHTGLTDK